jgi:hypothetical protein
MRTNIDSRFQYFVDIKLIFKNKSAVLITSEGSQRNFPTLEKGLILVPKPVWSNPYQILK